MRFFDLSQPLFDGCPNCPAHPAVKLPRTADHPTDQWRMEEFHMASHTGTHLDAPLHKLQGGKSIDQFPLETFTGNVQIVDLTNQCQADTAIGPTLLQKNLLENSLEETIVLLNTGWGLKRGKTEEWIYHSPFLSPEGSRWLADHQIKGVGIDHFSIGGTQDPDNTRTHEILLGANIWIVEELCFHYGWKDFLPTSKFMALPLSLPGFSGSPCRAVLYHEV